MDIKEAKEYSGYAGTLDRAIEILLKEQINNNNVYIDFNGHKLYSGNITVDGVYKEITGYTKQQHKSQQSLIFNRYYEERKINEQEPKSKINFFIKEGTALIYPERKQDWEKCVHMNIEYNYGIAVENAFEIMKALDKNVGIEEVNELVSREHSGTSFNATLKIVGTFSARGIEFYRSNMIGHFTNESYDFIKKINAENEIYLSNKLDKNLGK